MLNSNTAASVGGSAGVGYRVNPIDADKLGYNAISYDTPLGGATYPFLEQTGRAWHVLTRPVGEVTEFHPAHTLGWLRQPCVGLTATASPTSM